MKMTELLPFIEEALKQNKTFTLPITGTSMLPLLVQGRDTVTLSKIQPRGGKLSLCVGDLPLYRRKDGAFVLHRIVKIENGTYTMCGDNQFILEKGITEEQLIGVVSAITRDGKTFSVTEPEYKKYAEKMCKNVGRRYFKRRMRYKASMLLKRAQPAAENAAEQQKAQSEAVLKAGENLALLIRAAVRKEKFTKKLSPGEWQNVLKLSALHRVGASAALGALSSEEVPEDVAASFKKSLYKTSARYTAQDAEAKKISKAFSEKGIEHCFLKGTKIAEFYDEPDTRFMLDLDVLTDEKKMDEAKAVMTALSYTETEGDGKDVAFIKKPLMNIEVHTELKYEYDAGFEYYKDAYKRLVKTGNGAELKMTNEDFYVYVLSHTAHHFSVSGTGLRSVIDHWYLRQKLLPLCDGAVLKEALKSTGLSLFSKRMDELSEYLFAFGEKTDTVKEMLDYIILSGVFGTDKNEYVNGVINRGLSKNTGKYYLSRLFPPLDTMKSRYKTLEKAPVLLPAFWGARIVSSLFFADRIKNEAANVSKTSSDDIDSRTKFFNNMGL